MQKQEAFLKRLAALSPEKQALLEKRLRREGPQEKALTSDAVNEQKVFPLSFIQQRLWFLQELEPESSVYNEPVVMRIHGALDSETLTRALHEFVQRHAILRSTFPIVEGQVVQVIRPFVPETIVVPVVDLRAWPQEEREQEMRQRAAQELQRPFQLSQDLAWRTMLLRLDEEEYIFLTVLHHITTDAWSSEIFVRELGTLYSAFAAGIPSPLPELRTHYRDYVQWQQEQVKSGKLDKLLQYWQQQLGNELPVLKLPTDRPRFAEQSYRGSRHVRLLSAELLESLYALSRREGVTLFMTLLTAFKIVLYRYMRQTELVVGSPIAGRTQAGWEPIFGCFVNTLVLRTDVSGALSVRELLERIRQVTLGAYDHQELPFEKLVEELQPARDLSRSPLFQVLFALQNVPDMPEGIPNLVVERVELESTTTKFDLSLMLQETSQGLHTVIEYSTDLFDVETIERMQSHFQQVLEAMVANPEQRISDIRLLIDEERAQISAWNATERTYPLDQYLPELFEAQVARTPEAPALIFENEILSYQELNQRANQLAHYLRSLGVGNASLVGISLERSLEMVVSVLGVLKAGGAYVPLDPSYPSERLSFMIEDAQLSVLITQEHLLKQLPGGDTLQIICLERDAQTIVQQSSEPLPTTLTAEHLAYVIYTSGSTGRPKGVYVPHRAVVNLLLAMQEVLALEASDRLLAVTTLSFDIAVLELFLPLLTGACIVLARREETLDGQAILRLLEKQDITCMQATPVTWRLLLAAGWQGKTNLRILCGGEALSMDLARQLLERCAALYNGYGPTETAIYSTIAKIEPGDDTITIGRPIANTQTYILDEHLQQLPIGIPGELYIGGQGLAYGYGQRSDLTAERFLPHPYSETPGARFYKSGDMARYRTDGTIEYLGRNDQQVKMRGYRIELEEIETLLRSYPIVRDCAVRLWESADGDKRLVAYIVADTKHVPERSEIRAFLKASLPEYMLPTYLVSLEQLPVTLSGKLDRNALLPPDSVATVMEVGYTAPRTEIETLLASMWCQMLQLKQVSIHDNFFEIGGHSLLLTQMLTRVRDELQVDIPLRVVFRASTVAALAAEIERVKARRAELLNTSVTAVSRQSYRMKRAALGESSSTRKAEG